MGQSYSLDNYINQKLFLPPERSNTEFYSVEKENIKLFTINGVQGIRVVPNIKCDHKTIKTLIISNSTCADICSMATYLEYLSNELNICCISYDYPGYGIDNNIPNEQGCYDNHQIIVNYVINHLNILQKNIILMGISLGTGIVVDYVSKRSWNSPVILICPFKSVCTIMYDILLVKLIDKFRSVDKICNATCPIKIFHGIEDDFVDISHAKMLFENMKNKSLQPTWVTDADHANILEKITIKQLAPIIHYNN